MTDKQQEVDPLWTHSNIPNEQNVINTVRLPGQPLEVDESDRSKLAVNGRISPKDQSELMKRISDFVDQLRLKSEHESEEYRPQPRSSIAAPGFEEAQRREENAVIEVEKFRANVEIPPGKAINELLVEDVGVAKLGSNLSRLERPEIGLGLSDDDFFHLTCHIDLSMKQKIEKGCYMDLDKLLPKEKLFDSSEKHSNETKLEWVQSEGSTYLVPAKRASKINCFRRWEQAFCMYATIYCSSNPSRSREIWQHISVINTASLAYNWENVYNYNMIFRQLMEFNPARSWAVTYNQMWNLSMTNPILTNQNRRFSFQNNTNPNSGSSGGPGPGKQFRKKTDYCLSFNKGVKCKFGKKCKFMERCSYCDATNHGLINCDKLERRERNSAVNNMNRKSKK